MTSTAPFLWAALAAVVCAIPGCMMLFGSTDDRIGGWQRRRPHFLRRFIGLLLTLLALLAAAFAFLVYQYLQLFHDRPVALLELHQEAPQRFRVALMLANDNEAGTRYYDLHGDAWQIDARVLRWQLPAALAGVPSLYRLDRLSGRFDEIEQEQTAQRTVYAVGDPIGPDLFRLKQDFPRWLPFVDAQYGSGTWMPMFDGARYIVLFNDRGGLLARPADAQTAERLRQSQY